MNAFDHIRDAIAEAKTAQRAADGHTDTMAKMIAGRLRAADVSVTNLIALKREPRDFNIHTGKWMKRS